MFFNFFCFFNNLVLLTRLLNLSKIDIIRDKIKNKELF